MGDFANEPLTREERRRLTGVIVSLMIGATLGAPLLLHLPVYAPLFPLLVTLGVVIVAATAFSVPMCLGLTGKNSKANPT